MKSALRIIIMSAFFIILGAFSAFAGPESAEIAGDPENFVDYPGSVYHQTDKHYTGTTRIQPFRPTTKIVVEDGVIKTVYSPWYIQFDDSSFAGTNYIELDGTPLSTGENYVNDSVFSGQNFIDNEDSYPLKSNPTNTVNNSSFEDNTTIDTYAQLAQAEGTSAIGTQISGSTFNDNTTLNVQSGGTLEITDSTINLADQNIMDQYLGPNSWIYAVLRNIGSKMQVLFYLFNFDPATYGESSDYNTAFNSAFSTFDFYALSTAFRYPVSSVYDYSFSSADGFVIKSEKKYVWGPYPYILTSYIDMLQSYIAANIQYLFYSWQAWYYPFQGSPSYWYAWNSDTQQKEQTNIATVLYYISWYLGEIYKTDDWAAGTGFHDAQDTMEGLTSDMENAESAITGTVDGYLDSFTPDSSDITSLEGLSDISDLLQQTYVSLGAFAIPITLSLVLGVCLQLIGYFKYKG